jgi:hypothetical protein
LHDHGRRRRDHDQINPPPQQELANDKPGLHGLAETDVVGDQVARFAVELAVVNAGLNEPLLPWT